MTLREIQIETVSASRNYTSWTRIVMSSSSSRRRKISLAHIGHQVIIKSKRLLRLKVWFPNIDKMVEETVRDCLPCQAATSGNHPPPEPLKMTMRTLQKCIRPAIIEKNNWKQAMNQFHLSYRATPHFTTNTSPSERLNNRKMKTMLPEMFEQNRKRWLNVILRRNTQNARQPARFTDYFN